MEESSLRRHIESARKHGYLYGPSEVCASTLCDVAHFLACHGITTIRFNCSAFTPGSEKALSEVLLGKHSGLTRVIVSECVLDENTLSALATGVINTKNLTTLELELLEYIMEDPAPLVKMLRESKSLKKLVLDTFGFGNEAAVSVLEAASEEGRLESIKFGSAGIDHQGVKSMCAILAAKNKSLRSFVLKDVQFKDSTRTVANLLRSDEILRKFGMLQCGFSKEQGLELILDAVKDNKALRKLILKDVGLGKNGADCLGVMLRHNSILQSLRIQEETWSTRWAQTVYEALKTNKSLTELSIFSTYQAFYVHVETCWNVLAEVLRCNKALRNIKIFFNTSKISEETALALANAVADSNRLHSFRILPLVIDVNSDAHKAFKRNGSLLSFHDNYTGWWTPICDRNHKLHARAKKAVMTLLMIRWRTKEQTRLHLLAKDVVKIIARMVWESRVEVDVWLRPPPTGPARKKLATDKE